MEGHRAQRVIEALREELDELIGYEMADPRVEGVSVTEVILSPDSKKAVVRVAVPGNDEKKHREAVEALDHAKSFLKSELLHRLQMFRVPEFKFETDLNAATGGKVDFLLRRIKRGRPRDGEQSAS
ncbi:ribosome-binding factor A [Bryobacterales bacterium F-183]|nr:ribosome-binding factor A [Bryobacterales bacterium F-183]